MFRAMEEIIIVIQKIVNQFRDLVNIIILYTFFNSYNTILIHCSKLGGPSPVQMTEEGIVHGNKIAMDGPGDQLQQGGPSAPAPAQKQSGGPVIYCMTVLYRLSSKYRTQK